MLRGLDEELTTHKYSHVERERRFLVDTARRPDLRALRAILIEDRYVIGTRMRLRRMTDGGSGRVVLKLSKKYDVGDVTARPMVTAYLTGVEYDLLAGLPARSLVKRRYATGAFGIDVFEGALTGLELAEVECADDAALRAIEPPDWAVREVTHDARFQGGNLVLRDSVAALSATS